MVEQGYVGGPQPASKPVVQSSKKAVLVSAGLMLLLAGAAAALSAVLCSTALSCSVAPLSMKLRGSDRHQQDGQVEVTPELRITVSSGMACPVQYTLQQGKDTPAATAAPLLLGGAAAACVSGCQPRHSFW